MSRFLEMTVPGSLDAVAERAHRAFRTVGRVRQWEPEGSVSGTIRIDGYPIGVTITWKPARDADQVHLDISARSEYTISRAADGALYRFARAYRAAGWSAPARPARSGLNRWLSIGLVLLLLATIWFWRWTSVQ